MTLADSTFSITPSKPSTHKEAPKRPSHPGQLVNLSPSPPSSSSSSVSSTQTPNTPDHNPPSSTLSTPLPTPTAPSPTTLAPSPTPMATAPTHKVVNANWDYAIERHALIHNLIPRPLFQNNGLTPHSATFGNQGDISNLCNFGWYKWIYYRDHGSFPVAKEKLGQALGPIKNEGNEMAHAILTAKGTVISRRTIHKLQEAERNSETERQKRQLFDDVIRSKLGDSITMLPKPLPDEYIPYSDDIDPIGILHFDL
jgi:hypothetical protein